MELNIKEKREELFSTWEDVFQICKALVKAAKDGDLTLKASMLKEITTALKMSDEVLDKAEQMQRAAEREVDEEAEIEEIQRALEEAEKDEWETDRKSQRSAQAEEFRIRP